MAVEDGAGADNHARTIMLTAVGSQKVLNLAAPEVVTVLICFAQATEKGIELPENAVRERWPDAGTVLIAHIIDLTKVPALFRKIAEGVLANEHRKAVAALLEEQSSAPADYVVMRPDWSGEVARTFEIADPNVAMSCVVLAKNGRVVAVCSDPATRERDVVAAVGRALEEE